MTQRRVLLSSLGLALLLGLLSASGAHAQFIDSDSLFLAPSTVPYADYSSSTFTVSPGASLVFSGAQAGGSLTSVQVLPELINNPFTVQGDYDDSGLSNVSLGNYNTFYALHPNADYSATLISANTSTLTFNAAGTYFVRLDGSVASTYVVQVGTGGFLEDLAAGVKDNAGPKRREVGAPGTNLVLVSTNDPTDNAAGGALDTAFQAASMNNANTQKTTSLADAVTKIQAAYVANGNKKISVTLIGHGRSGSIKIDNQRINNFGDGTQTPLQFQQAIDPFVNSIDFYSCSTGAGAAGGTFLDTFAKSIGQASSFDGAITPYKDGTKSGFSANANVKRITVVAPEPGSFALLFLGVAPALCLCGSVRSTRRRSLPGRVAR